MFERLDSRSDVFAQVLGAVRLGGALSARTELRGPWALHFDGSSKRAAFHVVAEGTCTATVDSDDTTITLEAGDVVLLPGGAGHTLGDRAETPALEFADLVAGISPGERVRVPTGGAGDPTTLLCGSYEFAADGPDPLLRGLPELLHVPAAVARDPALAMTTALLAGESRAADTGSVGAGSAVVVERLVDLLFVYALRAWLDLQGDAGAPSWFGALHDPVVGPAVRAIHEDPARAWTVAELARRTRLSRAPFARRFREAVGEPPLAYVTRWRMALAAERLGAGARIAQVAPEVGYDNEFAFAKAFKRVRGVAPGHYRRLASTPSQSG